MFAPDPDLPGVLYNTEQIYALERRAIQTYHISGFELMRRAAQSAYQLLCNKWPDSRTITIFCGAGNNAGDGYALANLACQDNKQVVLCPLLAPEKLHGDALLAYQALPRQDINICTLSDWPAHETGLIVDAILGIGLNREVGGIYYQAIRLINSQTTAVLALDIPSGLNANSGMPMGIAVTASATISFIGMKRGLLTGQASDYVGRLYLDKLDVPAEAYTTENTVTHLSLEQYGDRLRPRPRRAHKGHFGWVLVIGGDHGYAGAILMAAIAAARCGAGRISVATRKSHAAALNTVQPEIMVHGIEKDSEGLLQTLLSQANMIVLGPGLGLSEWGRYMLDRVLKEDTKPLLIDADGLNLLAQNPQKRGNWILTPHPGEAARLLGIDTATVQKDRFHAASMLQKRYAGNIVLKGSGTIISNSQGQLGLCSAGNPGMASGGMGDVLSGVIGGLKAQGHDLDEATSMGVCLHASAGDHAAKAGERGLLASDLMPWIRKLVNP